MKLEHKTILITGASSGLGRALALSLAGTDNRLVVTARREGHLFELQREIEQRGGRCLVRAADATDRDQSRAVVDAAVAEFGAIDVAVLNAGGAPAIDMATAEVDAVLDVMRKNYDTLVNFLCPIIAHMKQSDAGTIVYTGSPAGYFGLPKSGPYSAAKAAGRVLFDTCRIELARTRIRLVALYPGFTYTEGLVADEVPFKSLIIDTERATREIRRAIERGRAHAMFPRRIRLLMAIGRLVPEPLRRRVLAALA